MTAAEYLVEGTLDPVSFASLLDLARLRIGRASAETCDACNTLNLEHACVCKCCAHRLPAFYGSRGQRREHGTDPKVSRGARRVEPGPQCSPLSSAFSFLIDSLKLVAGVQPLLVMGPPVKDASK